MNLNYTIVLNNNKPGPNNLIYNYFVQIKNYTHKAFQVKVTFMIILEFWLKNVKLAQPMNVKKMKLSRILLGVVGYLFMYINLKPKTIKLKKLSPVQSMFISISSFQAFIIEKKFCYNKFQSMSHPIISLLIKIKFLVIYWFLLLIFL